MAMFICPTCDKHSEMSPEGAGVVKHMCPHCGQEFEVDRELNVIVGN